MNPEPLDNIIGQGQIWRGRDFDPAQSAQQADAISSGYPELDRTLPSGGWPRGALTEILHPHSGQGELQLLLPALVHLTQTQRYIICIDPPWLPYAPALVTAGIKLDFFIIISTSQDADRHWALEQTLRASQCAAVLGWPGRNLDNKTLRRLQLAAEAGNSCGFLFRHPRFRNQHSPAALRLQLYALATSNQLEVIKCRGRHPSVQRIELPRNNQH